MKKSKFETLIKNRIEEKTLNKLNTEKTKHSKVKNLEYNNLSLQKYLKPNSVRIKPEEGKKIFELRSRMTRVKCNYKNEYEELLCRACNLEEETQKHVFECKNLNEERELKCNYEKIENGSLEEKLLIVKKFEENLKKLTV